MNGAVWKSNVRRVGSSIDRCRDQIDRLEKMENFKKEIYSNANTRVEVSIKTRRPSSERETRKEKNWSSLMSESCQSSPELKEEKMTRTRPKKEIQPHRGVKPVVAKKLNTAKNFAQATKSSRAKKLGSEKSPKSSSTTEAKLQRDEVDFTPGRHGSAPPGVDFAQHRFQSRTLNIFLKEMRSALKSDNITEAYKILEDLEYVAKNLESPKRLKQSDKSSPAKEAISSKGIHDQQKSKLSDQQKSQISEDKKSQIYEMTLLRSEAKRLTAENRDLKRTLSEMEHQMAESENEIRVRDENISNLKIIISRITSNNNDMLAILASKASIEDSVKLLEVENSRLSRDFKAQRQRNAHLENQVRHNEAEAARMHRIITDLKSSLNRNLHDESLRKSAAAVAHDFTESTIDLELSSDSKSLGASDADNDDDSAIGKSHPLSSAATNKPPKSHYQLSSRQAKMQSFASTKPHYQASGVHQSYTGRYQSPPGQQMQASKISYQSAPGQQSQTSKFAFHGHADQYKEHQILPTAPYLYEESGPATNLNSQMTPRVTQQDNVSQSKTLHEKMSQHDPSKTSQFQDDFQAIISHQRASQNQEGSPFKAAQLHLSETRNSDVSTGDEDKTISSRSDFSSRSEGGENVQDVETKQLAELAKKAALSAMAQQVDAKVQSFFDRLRNDAKFQVSLSSEMMKTHENLSTIGDISGLTTDVEVTADSKMQEETINLSNNSN